MFQFNDLTMHKLEGHDKWVNHCIFSQTGDLLATASEDRTVKVSCAAISIGISFHINDQAS